MDAAVSAAVTAVPLDDTVAQRWFELIRDTVDTGEDDWSRFADALTAGADTAGIDRHVVEQFVEYMNADDAAPMDTVRRMAEMSDELPVLYHQLIMSEAGGDTGYDESTWHTFLAENGVRWDGSDASWDQFTAWFVYEAGQQGLGEPAAGFVTYVAGQSDKVAAFAEYGITVGTAENQESQDFPEMKLGDSGEWVEYLDTMLSRHGF